MLDLASVISQICLKHDQKQAGGTGSSATQEDQLKSAAVAQAKVSKSCWVVAHAFNPSTQRGRGRQIPVSSRLAWSTE